MMQRQRMDIMIGVVIDCDKWLFKQKENERKLRKYLETTAQDKINEIQGGRPLDYDGYFEIEYSDPILPTTKENKNANPKKRR